MDASPETLYFDRISLPSLEKGPRLPESTPSLFRQFDPGVKPVRRAIWLAETAPPRATIVICFVSLALGAKTTHEKVRVHDQKSVRCSRLVGGPPMACAAF